MRDSRNDNCYRTMAITDNRSYIRWDATGVEEVPSDEMSDIEAVKAMVSGLQQHMHGKNGYAFNSTHAKTQGIVKGKLVVPEYLAPQLKQTELFSKGGEYPVVCRYSSANPEPSTPVSLRFPIGRYRIKH